MTNGGIERDLREWFATEAAPAPDRLRHAVANRLSTTRQGRSKSFGWGAAGVLLAAVLVIAGALLIGSGRQAVMPASSPSPSSTSAPPTPTPRPTPEGTLLSPGTLTTERLRPAISLTVPGGWTKVVDLPAMLLIVPPNADSILQANEGTIVFDSISIYSNPVAGPADGSATAEPGVGRDARSLSLWLKARPQLVASDPVSVTIGTLHGYSVDYSISASAGGLCGVRCVNVFNMADGIQSGILEGEADRAILLDVPGGGTLLVLIEDADGRDIDAFRAVAEPVIRSLALASL